MKACTKLLAAGLLAILLAGCQLPARRAAGVPPGVRAAVMGVLDRNMDALDALDIEAHVATYPFPHFRPASGQLAVRERPEQAMPVLALRDGSWGIRGRSSFAP